MQTMQEKFAAALDLSVSPTRLQAYRLATDRDDLDALAWIIHEGAARGPVRYGRVI